MCWFDRPAFDDSLVLLRPRVEIISISLSDTQAPQPISFRLSAGRPDIAVLIATLFLPSCQRSLVAALAKPFRTQLASATSATAILSAAAYKADITSQVLLGLAFASLVT